MNELDDALTKQRADIVRYLRWLADKHEEHGVPEIMCFAIRSAAGLIERKADQPNDPVHAERARAWAEKLDELLQRRNLN